MITKDIEKSPLLTTTLAARQNSWVTVIKDTKISHVFSLTNNLSIDKF